MKKLINRWLNDCMFEKIRAFFIFSFFIVSNVSIAEPPMEEVGNCSLNPIVTHIAATGSAREILGSQNGDWESKLNAIFLKTINDELSSHSSTANEGANARQKELTLEKINNIYQDVLQGGLTTVLIEDREPKERFPIEKMTLVLSFKNKEGRIGGEAWIKLRGGNSPIPELYIEQIYLHDKALSDGKVAARFLLANMDLLRLFNNRPEAKISLKAWTGETSLTGQEYGGYIWGPYGFEYDPIPLSTGKSTDQTAGKTSKRLGDQFIAWLKMCYGPERNTEIIDEKCDNSKPELRPTQLSAQLSKDELDRLIAKIQTWEHPCEMALFDTQQELGRPLGKFFGKLGKEFMTDSKAKVRWQGHLNINKKDDPGLKQFFSYVREVLSRPSRTR